MENILFVTSTVITETTATMTVQVKITQSDLNN